MSKEDALNFACNSVVVGDDKNDNLTLIGHKYSNTLKKQFERVGLSHIECDMSEFLLSGGSTKCAVIDTAKK